MYRASATGGSPLAAVLLVAALVLGTAGCGGDHETVASVTISAAATELNEGEDRKAIGVTLTLSEAVTGAVTIALASTGSATLGSDFDLASTEVAVAAGSTRATMTITPIRDLEAEGDEIITLEIDSVAGRGEIGSPSSVHIAIRDLGSPPPSQDKFAVLEAFMLLSGRAAIRHRHQRPLPDLYCRKYRPRRRVSHRGRPGDHDGLVSETAPFRQLATRSVPALERVVHGSLTRSGFVRRIGPRQQQLLRARGPAVAEEDPDGRGGLEDYTAVF